MLYNMNYQRGAKKEEEEKHYESILKRPDRRGGI